MSLKSERNFWRTVGGLGLLVGLVIMIAAAVMLFNDDDTLNKTPSRIEAIGVAIALCGVAALVLSRLLSMLVSHEREPNLLWTAVSYGSVAIGILTGLVEEVMRANAVRGGLQDDGFMPWQKAVVEAAGFFLMTGVISLIGERTARLYVKYKALPGKSTGAGR